MSGSGGRRAARTAVLMAVLTPAVATMPAVQATDAERPVPPRAATPTVTLTNTREPAQVGQRLTAICEDAGYAAANLRNCAVALGAMCKSAGIAADSTVCWQHLVDLDVQGGLDRALLRTRK